MEASLQLYNSSLLPTIVPDMGEVEELDDDLEYTKEQVREMIASAAEEVFEDEAPERNKEYEKHTESIDVRSLLKRIHTEKLQIPLFQRKYVWTKAQRESLMKSVQRRFPCGEIIIGEYRNVYYLIDGLQRVTSLMMLYRDDNYSEAERRKVLQYAVNAEVVHDITPEEMQHYFSMLNSGTIVSAAVKERTKLGNELNAAILEVSSHELFSLFDMSSTFNRNAHHELIAENALLAASGESVGENKAKALCKRMSKNEQKIIASKAAAMKILDTIKLGYEGIKEEIAVRSFKANFLSVLVYYIDAHPQTPSIMIKRVIEEIFCKARAPKDYSATTRTSASDKAMLQKRLEYIEKLFEKVQIEEFDIDGYTLFCQNKRGSILKDTTSTYILNFEDCNEDERRSLYKLDAQKNSKQWDETVWRIYRRLETEIDTE